MQGEQSSMGPQQKYDVIYIALFSAVHMQSQREHLLRAWSGGGWSCFLLSAYIKVCNRGKSCRSRDLCCNILVIDFGSKFFDQWSQFVGSQLVGVNQGR